MTAGRKIPKRFWWTKRIFACWLVLVAAAPISRCWWNHLAEKRLAGEVAAIQARGERLDWVNMAPPRWPDEQNAAVYYRQAFALLITPETARQRVFVHDLMGSASYRAKHAVEAEAILTANAALFDLSRQARSMPGVDWGLVHTSPASVGAWPNHLVPSAFLAWWLHLRAIWQAEHGDSAGAIETLRDMEALARAVSMDGSINSAMFSINIHTTNVQAIEDVAPLLAISAGGTATQPADPPAIRALIADLLADYPLNVMRQGMLTERARMNDVAEWMIDGGMIFSSSGRAWRGASGYWDPQTWGNPWRLSVTVIDLSPRWWFKPLCRLDQRAILISYSQMASRLSQPSVAKSAPLTQGELLLLSAGRDNFYRVLHPLNEILPTYGMVMNFSHRSVAGRRLAAIALALRLFELEKGRAAESLEQLVSEHLPAVPQDPFDPAGGWIRALLSDAKPRLYSLDENMLDDGGTIISTAGGGQADIVLFLRAGDRPESALSAESIQPSSKPSTAPTTGKAGP